MTPMRFGLPKPCSKQLGRRAKLLEFSEYHQRACERSIFLLIDPAKACRAELKASHQAVAARQNQMINIGAQRLPILGPVPHFSRRIGLADVGWPSRQMDL